jgi:chromosome segregation ATPase
MPLIRAYFCRKQILKRMKKQFLLIAAVAFILVNCGKEEKTKLQSQVDSLRSELETSQQLAKTLGEVGVLMDSIDANRQVLRMNMMEGTTFDNYTNRMEDLNKYVKDTEKKISDLEKELKKSKANTNYFSVVVKNLKAEIEKKNQEISILQDMVAKYQNENENLVKVNEMQEAEIVDQESQLAAKQQELALIEARIQELMIQSKVSEAEQFYARGVAVEEAANKIKLAPRKKKDTLKEALEYYKKSLSLGHQPAKAKIDNLEKLLK